DVVLHLARRFAATLVLTDRPERLAALRARLAGESLFAEELDFVFNLRHSRLDERARYKDVSRLATIAFATAIPGTASRVFLWDPTKGPRVTPASIHGR